MVAIGDVDELRSDAKAVAGFAHTAFEDCSDVELFSYEAEVYVLALERKRAATGDNVKIRDVGEGIYDLLGAAVGEKFVLRVCTHVGEWKHGDGLALGTGAYGSGGNLLSQAADCRTQFAH